MEKTATMNYQGADGVREHDRVIANTRQTLKRATDVIVAFNAALFGKKERPLDQVIADMSDCSYKLNGMRENKITMLLKELKEWRKTYGQLPRTDEDQEHAPLADEEGEPDSGENGVETVDSKQKCEETQLNYFN